MKNRPVIALFLGVGLLMGGGSLFAHHGTAGAYDGTKTITLEGTVVEFVWANPHGSLWFEVKDNEGDVVRWGGELHSILLLIRAGWTRTSVRPGDQVTVTLNPSTRGLPTGQLQTVTLSDGTVLRRDPPRETTR